MNVAYAFDDHYAKYGGISLLSLLENNQDIETISVFIIGDNLTTENVQKLRQICESFQRSITFINISDLIPELDVIPVFGKSAYGRLFLSNHIDGDSVFYFDSDTIIVGALNELLEIDMTRYLIAGVQDTVNPYYFSQIGLTNHDLYINSGGVIIINLKLWKKMEIEKKCVDFIKHFNGNPPHNDQGAINSICKGYILKLHPKYNLMNPMFMFSASQLHLLFKMKEYYTQQQLDEAIKRPVVIHYTAEFFNRPWFTNCTHPLKEIFLCFMNRSLWKIELEYKALSKNCRIQNWVYRNCPFLIYKLMIRYIEFKHNFFMPNNPKNPVG